ncbi:MAG: PAS domain-containing protein [Bacteroidia bacterium]|nr:PAS domain-containing protein [Bacteroidia bacterium]
MKNYAQELFLMITTLSQLRNKDRIVQLFIESINDIFNEYSFAWFAERAVEQDTVIEVCTRNKNYGFISFTKDILIDDPLHDLIINAAQLLAILLEKSEQDKLLLDQKNHLQILVDQRTKELHKVNLKLENELTERKRTEQKLCESEALLNATQKLSKVGGWEFNVETGKSFWTEELYRIHELPADSDIDHIQESLKCYRPEDRPIIHEAFQRTIEKGEAYDLEFPFTTFKGRPLWIRTTAQPVYEKGKVVRIIGNIMDITEHKKTEYERNEHIRFLESLARVDQAIKEETDVEKMLTSVVNTVLSIFDCDRIWLVFPCDPDAPSFRVPVEVYKPEYPGAKVMNIDVPMSPGESRNMREALESDNPLTYTAGTDRPIMTAKQFGVQSQMFISIYPKIGKPWVFGMHQCSHPRVWTKEEQQLFKEISRRVADSLTSLLMLQDLIESKRTKTELLEKLNETQNIAMIGSWEWDLLTNLVWWSDETYRIFGITEQDFVPDFETNGKFIYPDDIATYGKSFEHSLQTGEPFDIDFRLITNDGLLKTCQSKGKIVYNDSHKPIRFIGTIMDITEHKRREGALQRMNRELQAISDCNQVMMRAEDEQTLLNDICHIISNDAGYRLVWVGYAENDDAKTVRPVAWAGFDSGYVANAKLSWSADTERGRGPGGEAIRSGKIIYMQDFSTNPQMAPWRESALQRGYHSAIGLPLKDENANVFGVLLIYSTLIDAFTPDELRLLEELASNLAFGIIVLRARTERSQAEEELRSASLYARSLIEAALDPLVTISPDGKITDVNRATESVTGVPREQMIFRDFSDYFTEPEKARAGYRQVLAQGLVRDYPLTIRHTSGKTTDVLYNATIYRNESGELKGVFAAAHDITARKEAEDALRNSENDLKEAQRLGRLGGWNWDITTDTITWSEEYYHIYGMDPTQPPPGYEEHLKAYTPESAAHLDEAVKRNVQTGEPYEVDLELSGNMGPCRWITARSETKYDDKGQIVGLRGTAQDITGRKQAEQEIQKLNQKLENRVAERTSQLEAANKELEAFAYSVSHDLRAPLRGIDGFSQVLLEEYNDQLDAQGQDYLHRVRSASQRMGQLIDDMLNLSRVTRSEINIQQVNLSEMFKEIADAFLGIEPERQVEFIIQKGIKEKGDSHLLRIVLENLIGNAWKFTSNHPTARIEFGVQHKNETQVYFVRDDGAGFNMKYAQKLFGAFQRLHKAAEFPGTGIGLATVQRVIHRHGGKIWAEAEIEKGATIYFTIP